MKTLKQHIIETYKAADDIDDLWDVFEWKGEDVWEGDYDEHRWYINSTKVVKFVIDEVERYFEYEHCNPKGDDAREDCGWEKPDLDDLTEVFPKLVQTMVYVTKDKL